MLHRFVLFSAVLLLAVSCNEDNNPKESRPIVLGDSSTIVTETDPRYLTNFVDDIQTIPQEEESVRDTAQATEAKDTARKADPLPPGDHAAMPAAGKGLNIPFKEFTAFIPGIETRTFQKQNLEKANGASYQLTGGKLAGNRLELSGAEITKVSQRYISKMVVKNEMGTLELDGMDNLTGWTALNGNGRVYPVTGLEAGKLEHKKATAAQIKAAVTRSARSKRMSRKTTQNWEASVRNIRAAGEKPVEVVLGSVMWKIEGKDDGGRYFQKQIRIDL